MPLLYLEPSTGPQYSVAKSYLINLPDPTIGWKETENSHKKDKERRKKWYEYMTTFSMIVFDRSKNRKINLNHDN